MPKNREGFPPHWIMLTFSETENHFSPAYLHKSKDKEAFWKVFSFYYSEGSHHFFLHTSSIPLYIEYFFYSKAINAHSNCFIL